MLSEDVPQLMFFYLYNVQFVDLYNTFWLLSIFTYYLTTISVTKPLYPLFLLYIMVQYIRSTYIDFAENQLSLSLIGLSPLHKCHPSILQHTLVQS